MAKRKSSTRHGHSGDPRKRAAGELFQVPAEAAVALKEEVEAALGSGHPIDIVTLASSLIAGLDPDLRPPGEDLPAPVAFVRMFLESSDPLLKVLAWTVSRLLPDAALRTEVDGDLAPGIVPDWLLPLDRPDVVGAWQTTDPLRDSTDVVVSLRVGQVDLTVIALIDFNSEVAVKDGFVVPAPLTAVKDALSASGEMRMETRWLDPADAGVWLTGGIAAGRLIQPPFESDSWPQARPLVEWVARLCPVGGRGWQRPQWDHEDLEKLVVAFAGSPAGAVITGPADRAVLVDALHGLAGETAGDPLLPSAVRLEIGLGYLWSTTLHHDLEQLLALPEMLGPYTRWAHAQCHIPPDDTDEALAAVAHHRTGYVRDVVEVNDAGHQT